MYCITCRPELGDDLAGCPVYTPAHEAETPQSAWQTCELVLAIVRENVFSRVVRWEVQIDTPHGVLDIARSPEFTIRSTAAPIAATSKEGRYVDNLVTRLTRDGWE